MPGLLRDLHSADPRFLPLVPGTHGTDSYTMPYLPASLGSHMKAAVACALVGECQAEDKAKEGQRDLERLLGEFLKHNTQAWEGTSSVNSGGWAGTDLQSYPKVLGVSPKRSRKCLLTFKEGVTFPVWTEESSHCPGQGRICGCADLLMEPRTALTRVTHGKKDEHVNRSLCHQVWKGRSI